MLKRQRLLDLSTFSTFSKRSVDGTASLQLEKNQNPGYHSYLLAPSWLSEEVEKICHKTQPCCTVLRGALNLRSTTNPGIDTIFSGKENKNPEHNSFLLKPG